MDIVAIVACQFGLGLLMIIWRYGVIGVAVKTTLKGVWCFLRMLVWITLKVLLYTIWLVCFCGCCCRCSLSPAREAAARCVERVQDIASSIFLKNTCWELDCKFTLPTKMQSCKDWMWQKHKKLQKSPVYIALRPQWYWLHLTAQVGFLWREFVVITMHDGWYTQVVLAYAGMGAVVAFSAQQVWKFSKVRNLSGEAGNVIDQVLDMLLLPINYGFLCALTVRSLKMAQMESDDPGPSKKPPEATTQMAIAVVDSADVWESWALWSVLQLFIRVVDFSAKGQVGADQDSKQPLTGSGDNDVPQNILACWAVGALDEPDQVPKSEVRDEDLIRQGSPGTYSFGNEGERRTPPSANSSDEQLLRHQIGGDAPNEKDVVATRLVPSQPLAVQGDDKGNDSQSDHTSDNEATDFRGRYLRGQSMSEFVENLNLGSKYLDVVSSFKYLSEYGVQSWVYLLMATSFVELVVKGYISPHFPTTCFKLFGSCDKSCDAFYDDDLSPSVYVVTYILACLAIIVVVAFERTFKEYLHAIEPYWKFWGVKIVVSVTFAQKFAINHCCGFKEWEVYLYHCLIVCLELPMLCAVHTYLSYPFNQEWMFLLIRSSEGDRDRDRTLQPSAEQEQAATAESKQDRLQQEGPEVSMAMKFQAQSHEALTRHQRRVRGRSPQRGKAGRGSSCSSMGSTSSEASNVSKPSRPSPHIRRMDPPTLRRNKTDEAKKDYSIRPGSLPPKFGRSLSETRGRGRENVPTLRSLQAQGEALGPAPAGQTPELGKELESENAQKGGTDVGAGAESSKPDPDVAQIADSGCGCWGEEDDDSDLDEEQAARKAADSVDRPWVAQLYVALGIFWCFIGITTVQTILPLEPKQGQSASSQPKIIPSGGSCSQLPSDFIDSNPNNSYRLPNGANSKVGICQSIPIGCAQGFRPKGNTPPQLACTASSRFDVTGTCETTKCGPPDAIPNAHPKTDTKECCWPGQEVDWECNKGYTGRAKSRCVANDDNGEEGKARWITVENSCQIVGCGQLENELQQIKVYLEHKIIIPPKSYSVDADSFDGQVVNFTCAEGLRGNPQAICYAQHWHMTDSGNTGGDPCAPFVTAHGCHCQKTWRHCSGRYWTDCYDYHGCARTPDKGFAWCRVEGGSGTCQDLSREKDFFGYSQDWDYCVDDNFGKTWEAKPQPSGSFQEGMRSLAPQFIFGLTLVLVFCLTFYLPVWAFGVIVYCIPRFPGWEKVCHTCSSRTPRAIRRIWMKCAYRTSVDVKECCKWSSKRWATFMLWCAQQTQEWRQWFEGDTAVVHPTNSPDPEKPGTDAAKLNTGVNGLSVPQWLQWGFIKTKMMKDRTDSSSEEAGEPEPEDSTESDTKAASDGKSLTTPLLQD